MRGGNDAAACDEALAERLGLLAWCRVGEPRGSAERSHPAGNSARLGARCFGIARVATSNFSPCNVGTCDFGTPDFDTRDFGVARSGIPCSTS
jgi:hypothetical protein